MLDAIQLSNNTFIAEIRTIYSSEPEFIITYKDIINSGKTSSGYYKARVRIEQWIYSSNQYKNFDLQLPNLQLEESDIFIKTENDNPRIWKGPKLGEKYIFVFTRSFDTTNAARDICIGRLDVAEKNAVIRGIAKSIQQRMSYFKKWIDWNLLELE